MLLGILGATFLGKKLTVEGVKTKIPGGGVIRACKGTITVRQDF